MDDQVLAAMRKWPDVPAVHGWLRLGRRGGWFLIDRGAPGFDPVRDGDGSPITSPPILDFIARNYAPDPTGAWFWQNGPQRVFVDLELAPWVLRVLGEASRQRLVTHTGHPVGAIERVASDADGNLFIVTDLGPGVVDDRDIGQLVIEAADRGRDDDGPADDGPADDGPADDAPADDLLLVLDGHPGPRRLGDGRRAWPIEPLAVHGADAIGAALGFQPRPRPSS